MGERRRLSAPANFDVARRVAAKFVVHYNGVRLPDATGHFAPADKLAGSARAMLAF